MASRIWKFLRSTPGRTWIDPSDLQQLLPETERKRLKTTAVDSREPPQRLEEKVERAFARTQGLSQQRFLLGVRNITVIWSFLVAVYFQVSAPDLLKSLSKSPQLRAAALENADDILTQVEPILEAQHAYVQVSDDVLRALQAKYPELRPAIEQASGIGADRDEIVEELRNVLSDVPGDHEALIREYQAMLDAAHRAAIERSQSDVTVLREPSAIFDITGWKDGWDFYVDREAGGDIRFHRLLGVAITSILLTFGAPFWFERLRELARLRDVFDQRRKTSSEKP